MFQLHYQCFFAFFTVNVVFVLGYDSEPFLELLLPILFAHMLGEFSKAAWIQVYHLILLTLISFWVLYIRVRLHTAASRSYFIQSNISHYLNCILLLIYVNVYLLHVVHVRLVEKLLILILLVIRLRCFVLINIELFHLFPSFLLFLLFLELRQHHLLFLLLPLPIFLFFLFFLFPLFFEFILL